MTDLRVSRTQVEVLIQTDNPSARLSRSQDEALIQTDNPQMRLSRAQIEALTKAVTSLSVELAEESNVASDVALSAEPVLTLEVAEESDVAFEVEMEATPAEPEFFADLAEESDVATDVTLRTDPLFSVEVATEHDVASEVEFGPVSNEIHYAAVGIDAPTGTSSTSFVTKATITAAELATAGFEDDDEAIVLFFGTFAHDAGGSTAKLSWRLTYNSTSLHIADPLMADPSQRNAAYMTRISLGTLADIDLDLKRVGGSGGTQCYINVARVVLLRVADLGTEGTDWWWNRSTTSVANTTTYAATSRASITWTPPSVQHYLALFSIHEQVDTNTSRGEARLYLDGTTLIAGDFSEEGETLDEERPFLTFGVMEDLAASSHSLAVQSRDDTFDSPQNSHRESSILLLRAAHYPNLFWHQAGDTNVTEDDPTQLATINNEVAADQDALLVGTAVVDIAATAGSYFAWVRRDDTDILPPETDTSMGFSYSNARAFDSVDELQAIWLTTLSLTADVPQNLDFFVEHSISLTIPFLRPAVLLWGFSFVAAPPPPPIFEAELATERDIAYQANLVTADDLSTVVTIEIVLPPTLEFGEDIPARGIGVVQTGVFKPKIYHPDRKIVRT